MGSPSVAPPDGFELDEQPNAMRQGFGRFALSPAKLQDVAEAIKAAPGVIGNAMTDLYGRMKRWESDPSLPSSRGDEDIGADALALGPGMLTPGFGRAVGGLGAAGGQTAKTTWTPTMVRKLRELDGQFASETARGAKGAKIIENFREVFPDYTGSDANIKTMISRTKNWGGVNEATGAAEAAGSSESGFELGAFGGRRGARNMEAAGRPVPNQALDMAERMDAAGYDYDQIRRTVNEYIKRNDPHLGGVTQGADKQWRFEISDRNAGITPELQQQVKSGTVNTTLGEGFAHPELYQAYPELAGQAYQAQQVSKPITRGSYAAPVEHSPELEAMIGPGSNGRAFASSNSPEGIRSVTLHEAAGHGVQAQEGFARGGPAYGAAKVDKDTAIDIMSSWQGQGSLTKHITELQQAGELSEGLGKPSHIANRVNYWRLAGEAEAGLVQARRDMTPSQLRKVDPKLMQDIPEEMQIVRGARAGEEAAIGDRVTPDQIHGAARELGLESREKASGGGTTYVQVREPSGSWSKSADVRIPSADDPHAGASRGWRIDTSMQDKRNPTTNNMNLAGEPFEGNLPAIRDRLSYTFGKQPPETVPAPVAEGGSIQDPRQLKLLSGGLPPGFVIDDDNRNPMGQR